MIHDMANPIPIYCFPPAGGLARIYDVWRDYLPRWIEIIGVEYPGRGTRPQETAVSHIEALADDLVSTFSPRSGDRFAVLGLSMGGLVAFEFAFRLTQRGQAPIHLFVCSCRNPRQKLRQKLHDLPEEQFVAGLRRRQGSDRLVGGDGAAGHLEIEALRADVTASERYMAPSDRMISSPITVLGGVHDKLLSRRGLALWCLLTSGRFCFEQFPGGHFFFRNHLDIIVARILGELETTLHESFRPWPTKVRGHGGLRENVDLRHDVNWP